MCMRSKKFPPAAGFIANIGSHHNYTLFGKYGPRFSKWWTPVFTSMDPGFFWKFWWTPVWWTPVLVDPGLVDPGLLGWIPVSVNDLAVLNRPKYKGI